MGTMASGFDKFVDIVTKAQERKSDHEKQQAKLKGEMLKMRAQQKAARDLAGYQSELRTDEQAAAAQQKQANWQAQYDYTPPREDPSRLASEMQIGPDQAKIGGALALGPSPENLAKGMVMKYEERLAAGQPFSDRMMKQYTKLKNRVMGFDDTQEGFGSADAIPQEMGGLPLAEVTEKGGRFHPKYKKEKDDIFAGREIPKDEEGNYLKGEAFLKTLPPLSQGTIRGMIDYTLDPSKIFSMRSDKRSRYVEVAKYVDPSFNLTKYETRRRYLSDLGSGQVARNIRSINTAVKHLSSLKDSVVGLTSTNVKYYNAAINYIKKDWLGSEAPTDAAEALNAVAGEMASLFKGTSGTDQEITSWKETFDLNMSKRQKTKFIQRGVDLMEGRLHALREQYFSVMDEEAKEGTFISPTSKKIVGQLGSAGDQEDTDQQSITAEEAKQLGAVQYNEETGEFLNAQNEVVGYGNDSNR